MKAVVPSKYDPPEVLQLKEMEKFVPKENGVRIKVEATAVTTIDCVFRGGESNVS